MQVAEVLVAGGAAALRAAALGVGCVLVRMMLLLVVVGVVVVVLVVVLVLVLVLVRRLMIFLLRSAVGRVRWSGGLGTRAFCCSATPTTLSC